MPSEQLSIRYIFRRLLETALEIWLGEPACIVRASTLDRLERLAYRTQLQIATERGDVEFLASELHKYQLTQRDLNRLSRYHTPLERWPEPDDDLMADAEVNDQLTAGAEGKHGVQHL